VLRLWLPLIACACLVSAAQSGASDGEPRGTNFTVRCLPSHTALDDPIVYHGQPGRSHHHTFFGNRSTNASSTLHSLRGSGTTCRPRADSAAYWVPTLYRGGREVKPLRVVLYYQVRARGEIEPFPAGLKVLAGDPHAPRPQSTATVFWNCTYSTGLLKPVAEVPECAGRRRSGFGPAVRGGGVQLNVVFPDCWDGRRLDSPDHRSHMAYSRDRRCPRSHPVKVPRLRLTVVYPVRDGAGLALASGGIHSGHADFFNAWRQQELAGIIRRCSLERPRCARVG
jgi:Domain of unknown function (DUF1996)